MLRQYPQIVEKIKEEIILTAEQEIKHKPYDKMSEAERTKTTEKTEKKALKNLKDSLIELQHYALFAKANIIQYDDLRLILEELAHNLQHYNTKKEISEALAKVLDEQGITILSSRLMPGEYISALSKKDLALLYRGDTLGNSILKAIYRDKKSEDFSDEFMKFLLKPIMYAIAQDMAVDLSSGKITKKNDYSKISNNVIKCVISGIYYKQLEGFSGDIRAVPEAMIQGAGVIWETLEDVIKKLSTAFDINKAMEVTITKAEMPDLENDEKPEVNELSVLLESLYLNLFLLRIAFEHFLQYITSLNEQKLFDLINSAFIDENSVIGQDPNAHHNAILLTEYESLCKNLNFQEILSLKLNSEDFKSEFRKVIDQINPKKKAFLTELFKSPDVIKFAPNLSRYFHFLINYKQLFGKHKKQFIEKTRDLTHFINKPITDLTVEHIELLRFPESPKKEVSIQKNSDEKQDSTKEEVLIQKPQDKSEKENEIVTQDQIQTELKDLARNSIEKILHLYAKMPLMWLAKNGKLDQDKEEELASDDQKKEMLSTTDTESTSDKKHPEKENPQAVIPIFYDKDQVINTLSNPIIENKDYKKTIEAAFGKPLKHFYGSILEAMLSKKQSLPELHTNLLSIMSFICIKRESKNIKEKVNKLCHTIIEDLFKTESFASSEKVQMILACLTYLTIAFDKTNKEQQSNINKLAVKFGEKGYKAALQQFTLTPEKFAEELKNKTLKGKVIHALNLNLFQPFKSQEKQTKETTRRYSMNQ